MAFIRNTDKLIEGSSKLFFSNVRAKAAVQNDLNSLSSSISNEQSARQSEDSGIKLRLDVIEGGAGVSGSIAKAQADAQSYADQKVAALVNSAPSVLDTLKELSDAIGGDASFAATVAGQIGAVDDKVDQEILDRAAAISALESSIGVDISAEESRAMAAEAALDLRLDALELDPVSKTYVDGIESSLDARLDILEQDETTKAYVDAQVSAEQSRAEAAEGLLDGRLDVLESDPTTKTYVDGQVSGLQSQITQEISDRQSAVSAEESRAMAAEGLLDGRLDLLEADPVSKTYVDGEVSDLQGQITQEINDRQSAISGVQGEVEAEETRAMAAEGLLDGRLDVLELDPVTQSYVDSEVSGLQGQVDVEKGRIDAILSASTADKDSFAEIVSLINSVDTANDSAFAGYVLSNNAALAQEVSDRQAGDSALDGRLDVLESDPTTKTYVDGKVTLLQSEDLTFVKLDGSRTMTNALNVESSTAANRRFQLGASRPGNTQLVSSDVIGEFNYRSMQSNGVLSSSIKLQGLATENHSSSGLGSKLNIEVAPNGSTSRQVVASFLGDRVDFFKDLYASSVVKAGDGSTSAPSFGFSSAGGSNFGMYYATSGHLAFSAGNSMALRLGTSGNLNTSYRNMQVPDGASNAPGLCFNTDYSSGFFYSGTKIRATIQGTASLMEISSTAVAFPKNVEFSAGMKVGLSEKSADYTITTSDYFIGVTSVTGGKVMTLPTAVGNSGRVFIVKDQSGSASGTDYIRIAPQAGQTIDGQSNYEITVPYESVSIVSNGSNWFIM